MKRKRDLKNDIFFLFQFFYSNIGVNDIELHMIGGDGSIIFLSADVWVEQKNTDTIDQLVLGIYFCLIVRLYYSFSTFLLNKILKLENLNLLCITLFEIYNI